LVRSWDWIGFQELKLGWKPRLNGKEFWNGKLGKGIKVGN